MTEKGPVDIVRDGYDALSERYRGDDDAVEPAYASWLSRFAGLPAGSHVLDVGCGNGIPVARELVRTGLEVTGVDLSAVQIERARSLVPAATFVQADITELNWPTRTFDAVVALYSLIHIPLPRQHGLLARFADWTTPGGLLLLVTGATAWTGTDDHWLGGDTPMWWSHTDADTYRAWLSEIGWDVTDEQFVPEGDSGHQVFWARRSDGDGSAAIASGGLT